MKGYLREWLVVSSGIAVIGFLVYLGIKDDTRPDRMKWITDPRNGCVLLGSQPLANEPIKLTKESAQYKLLLTYTCNNNQLAAIIVEDIKDVK